MIVRLAAQDAIVVIVESNKAVGIAARVDTVVDDGMTMMMGDCGVVMSSA